MTTTLTYYCNLNLREKFFGYRPAHIVVPAGVTTVDNDDRSAVLAHAFAYWNADDRPNGQTAPSLSVGDVVEIVWDGGAHGWYACDRFGWSQISEPAIFAPDDPADTPAALIRRQVEIENERSFATHVRGLPR